MHHVDAKSLPAENLAPRATSVQNAAAALGIGVSSMYNLLQEGEIASINVGTRRLVVIASLDRFVKRAAKNSARLLPLSRSTVDGETLEVWLIQEGGEKLLEVSVESDGERDAVTFFPDVLGHWFKHFPSDDVRAKLDRHGIDLFAGRRISGVEVGAWSGQGSASSNAKPINEPVRLSGSSTHPSGEAVYVDLVQRDDGPAIRLQVLNRPAQPDAEIFFDPQHLRAWRRDMKEAAHKTQDGGARIYVPLP